MEIPLRGFMERYVFNYHTFFLSLGLVLNDGVLVSVQQDKPLDGDGL